VSFSFVKLLLLNKSAIHSIHALLTNEAHGLITFKTPTLGDPLDKNVVHVKRFNLMYNYSRTQ